MPNQLLRRAGIARIPLRVVLLVLVALAALAATGCADDDGISVLDPDRGLQGLWVRYVPPVELPAALPRPMDDTLFIANDLTGLWSREVEGSMGIVPLRTSEGVRVEQKGVRLFLFPLVAPCPACRVDSNDRMMALATTEPYRLRRIDADRFVLSPATDAGGQLRYYYQRRPVPPTIEE